MSNIENNETLVNTTVKAKVSTKVDANSDSDGEATVNANQEKERSKEKEYNPRKQEINTHTARTGESPIFPNRALMSAELYRLYPKKSGMIRAQKAAFDALDREVTESDLDYFGAFLLMLEAVTAYAAVTQGWRDQNQVMRGETFFSGGHYRDDWNTWLPRDKYGKTIEGACWDKSEINEVKEKAKEVYDGYFRK